MGQYLRAAGCLCLALVIGSCTPPTLRERDSGPLLDSQPVYEDSGPWRGSLPLLTPDGGTIPVKILRQLTSSEGRFGGWSAMTLDPDSSQLSALSDRGYWMRAPLDVLAGLQPPAALPLQMAALRDQDGEVMTETSQRDAEGLITLPNGGVIVSFERTHRLWYYPPAPPAQREQKSPVQNAAQALPTPPGLEQSPYNGGAETLDLLPDGSLLVIAEGEQGDSQTTGWIGHPQGPWTVQAPAVTWQRFRLVLSDQMNPTAATVIPGPDEVPYLVLVERSFSLTFGFRSRLSALPLAEVFRGSDQPVKARPLADLSRPPLNDNWEAIALDPRSDDTHAPTLWLMTDNNYNSFQRSMLLGLPLKAIVSALEHNEK